MLDLYYFFNMQAHPDVLDSHRNDLILTYYREFNSTLRKIGFNGNIPTLLDLHIELIQCNIYDFFQAVAFASPRYVNWAELDMEAFMADPDKSQDAMIASCFTRDDYLAHMKKTLTRHLHTGAMD